MSMALIDLAGTDASIYGVWKMSGFLEKIKQTIDLIALWGNTHQHPDVQDLSAFGNIGSLIEYCNTKGVKSLVYILAGQIFLDPDVVKNGIQKVGEHDVDYFTQWEFCRLPIGIGMRILDVGTLATLNTESPKGAIEFIMRHPQDFNILYDDEAYVSHKESMLDSRYNENNKYQLKDGKATTWDLSGFLSLAKSCPDHQFRYRSEEKTAFYDEKRLPSAYGFETAECAEFPTYIMIDLTNICNSKCIHCPHSTLFRDGTIKPIYLDYEIYKKAIDECKDYVVDFIRITADGETLLHPQLFDMVDYAIGNNVGTIGLTTNGSLMTSEKARWIAESGLSIIDISLDAIREETYHNIRRGLIFKKTMENVHYLIDYKRKIGSPLKIMVSFVEQEQNIDQLEDFKRYWEPLVDKVLIRQIITNANIVTVRSIRNKKNIRRWPCPHWFRRVVINYNGYIKACPCDWENQTAYRHMSATTIFDTWHSDFYWKNRIEHLNNSFSDAAICKKCKDWEASPWELGYEKVIKNLQLHLQEE